MLRSPYIMVKSNFFLHIILKHIVWLSAHLISQSIKVYHQPTLSWADVGLCVVTLEKYYANENDIFPEIILNHIIKFCKLHEKTVFDNKFM